MKKNKYCVGNWASYNRSLVNRGDLTIWFDEKSIKSWKNTDKTSNPGRPRTYSDAAILCSLSIKAIYKLSLRATQGMCRSIIKLMGLKIKAPDYTTLSRRQGSVRANIHHSVQGPVHLVFDSTGLKIFGDGEWKARQHGVSKRRVWRKLHLCVDESSGQLLSSELTTNSVGDSEVFEKILSSVNVPIMQASGDGAYDTHDIYRLLEARGALVTIPPRKAAKVRKENTQRNTNILLTNLVGSARWKRCMDYHRRSIAETTMMRFKSIFGEKLHAHKFENQVAESLIKCSALNRITQMGMPDTYRI